MNKERKNVVITGAAGGIGTALLDTFAYNGYNIWACVRQITDEFCKYTNKLMKNYGITIWIVPCDMSHEIEVRKAASEILAQKQAIDVIINNAAITGMKALMLMTPIEDIRNTFEINFFSQIIWLQLLGKKMIKKRNGSIINIVSIAAMDGEPAQIGYVASKAAMIGATKKMARELAPYHIRVNAVAPGIVNTKMGQKIEADIRNEIVEKVLLQRMAEPQEIANTVLFLASEDSSYINGQVIRVDGGI